MDFNILLIQLVLFSCVFSLIRKPRLPKGWQMVSGGILAVLGVTFLLVPSLAGWISGGLWAVLVLVPSLGFLKVNQLFYQERYSQARRLALGLRCLHPADGWWEYPEILRGLALGQQGKLTEANRIFSRYSQGTNTTGRAATVLLYRLEARWADLRSWIRQNWTEDKVFQEAVIGTYYLRSLGETGDVNALIQGVATFEQKFEKSGDVMSLNLVRMFAFAFAGQTDQVRQLFQGPLSVYSRETRQFWVATAELAAGHSHLAREQLVVLQQRCDPTTRNAIAWRLSHSLVNPKQDLTPASWEILAQLERTIQHEARYGGRVGDGRKTALATQTLISINVVMFLVEIWLGGSENLDTLYRMGALVPENVLAGEWWRVLTATFLHYGIVHLLANMLGLYILGMFVESILGVKKFLIAYFFCGIGSMLTIATLAILMQVRELLGVGASGAIMGLLGVMAAILLKGWRREKAQIAARRLRLVVLIVVLQVISDIFTPQVSLVGHASGLVLGFLIGNVLFKVEPSERFAKQ